MTRLCGTMSHTCNVFVIFLTSNLETSDVHSSHHDTSETSLVCANSTERLRSGRRLIQILAFLKIVFLDTHHRYMSIQTYISHKIRSLARFAHMPGLGCTACMMWQSRSSLPWFMDDGTSLRSPNPDLDSRQHPSPTNRPAWCFIIIHLGLISRAFTCLWRFPHGISSCRYLSTTSVVGRLLEKFQFTEAKWTIHGAVLFMSIFKREDGFMKSRYIPVRLWLDVRRIVETWRSWP